jgi:hypothetical protein
MKSAFDGLGVYQITRTSLPVRVYVDERGSERGAPRDSAPSTSTPLITGAIKGAANRGAYLDFNQHRVREFRAIERWARVVGAEVRVRCDAGAEASRSD